MAHTCVYACVHVRVCARVGGMGCGRLLRGHTLYAQVTPQPHASYLLETSSKSKLTNLFALYISSSGAARDPPADSEVSQAYTSVPTQAMAAHQIKREQMGTGSTEAGCCPESARDLSERRSRGPEGSTSSLHFTCSTKSMTCARGPM